tara:strand:+ start:2948 stop:3151 length:204 start_codon:yes stop_codon:yes gene_type:complete
MKILLLNIRKTIPYLILIAIYFFFINIEARNDQNNRNSLNDNSKSLQNTNPNEKSIPISIPVIPYGK